MQTEETPPLAPDRVPPATNPVGGRSWAAVGITLLMVLVISVAGIYLWVRKANRLEERARLYNSGTLTLVSLKPDHRSISPDKLHGWEVLGRVDLNDPMERRQLVLALNDGIAESDGTVAGCFNPRHAIVWTDGTDTEEFVICFECLSISVYNNGTRGDGFLTTSSPQPQFDQLLERHGVALAPH